MIIFLKRTNLSEANYDACEYISTHKWQNIEMATTVLLKTRKPCKSHPKLATEQEAQAGILLTVIICIGLSMESNCIDLETHYTFLKSSILATMALFLWKGDILAVHNT